MSLILGRWRKIASRLLFIFCFIVWIVFFLVIASIIVAIATGGTGIIAEIPVGLILTIIIVVLTLLMLLLTFVVLPIVFVLDLLLNFLMCWKTRGWKVAWSRLRSEAASNWDHIVNGAKAGINKFIKKIPGGRAMMGGVSRLAGGIKKVVDEGKKLIDPYIDRFKKWWNS